MIQQNKLRLKVSQIQAWREEQRLLRERQKTMLAKQRRARLLAEKASKKQAQLELKQLDATIKKLLLAKARGIDQYEDPKYRALSPAEQIINVINLRRQTMGPNTSPQKAFNGYLPWELEINGVNGHLPKEMRLTKNEVYLLFLNWEKIKKRYSKTHPELFTISKRSFPTPTQVEPGSYRININKGGSGPTFTVTMGDTPKPKIKATKKPSKQIQPQEAPILTRKERKKLEREKRNKRK